MCKQKRFQNKVMQRTRLHDIQPRLLRNIKHTVNSWWGLAIITDWIWCKVGLLSNWVL